MAKMTNLEKATKAYNKMMWDLGAYSELVEELIYREVIDGDYDIEDLVYITQCNLDKFYQSDTCFYEARFSDDYYERTEAEAEMKKYKYFIKKWKGVR